MPGVERYKTFGRLRNAIQHFAVPGDIDVADETIRFIYEVIDPFINKCWGLYAVDYNEDHEPYVYLVAGLIRRGIRFLVSPGVIKEEEWIDKNWPDGDDDYHTEMEKRFDLSGKKAIPSCRALAAHGLFSHPVMIGIFVKAESHPTLVVADRGSEAARRTEWAHRALVAGLKGDSARDALSSRENEFERLQLLVTQRRSHVSNSKRKKG